MQESDTFKKWSTRYLELKTREGIGNSRLRAIRNNIDNLSEIHNTPISEIRAWDIQEIIFSLSRSKKTLREIKYTAKSVLELAIENQLIFHNAANYIKIPINAPQTSRVGIDYEQQKWILDTPHRAQLLAMTMLFSGIRKGEAVALTWADIDFTSSQISITKSVEFLHNKAHIKAPKTKAGNRVIDIPNILLTILSDYSKRATSEYIFTSSSNEILTETAIKRLWESYMNELNLKYGYQYSVHKNMPKKLPLIINRFTMHQLRHTYATLLYCSGIDVVTARDYLGHANIQTTLNIYTHLDKKYKQKHFDKVNKYINDLFC